MTTDSQTAAAPMVDADGKPAPFQPGDRIVTLQAPWRGAAGEIVRQRLHYDGGEAFWGNCITRMDDGRLVEWNCWQLDREDGWKKRLAAKEAAREAELQAKERAELARLKKKYEGDGADG